MAFVTSVPLLGSPTNPQMLTALTENSTPVEGAIFSITYINSVVLSIVEAPLLVNWITYSRITPLASDGAVHEMVMVVTVVTAKFKPTISGRSVGKTNLVYTWFAPQHQTLPIPLVIACNGGEKSPMPASFPAAIVSAYLVQAVSPVS